jgi:hypothetical protein
MKLILGLGKTGVSIARFLTKQQVAFRIADNRNAPPFLSQFKSQFNTENSLDLPLEPVMPIIGALAWRENNSISLITGMLLTLAKTTIASF